MTPHTCNFDQSCGHPLITDAFGVEECPVHGAPVHHKVAAAVRFLQQYAPERLAP